MRCHFPFQGKFRVRGHFRVRCHFRRASLLAAFALPCGLLTGCANPTEYTWLGLGSTAYLAQAPTNEIEQVYYLGVFDPQDQVPPTIYRLTVRGQASAMSGMKFGSGWVHSSLVDSLETRVAFSDKSDRAEVETPTTHPSAELRPNEGIKTGRRLVMFGPEGFREAPRDHRLVIVMGASPEKFFNAMDQALSFVTKVENKGVDPDVVRQIIAARERLRADQQRIAELRVQTDSQLKSD